MLYFVEIGCFSQNWNNFNNIDSIEYINDIINCYNNVNPIYGYVTKYKITSIFDNDDNEIYRMTPYEVRDIIGYEKKLVMKCPSVIYDNYKIGDRCYKAGWATFISASIMTIVGGIVYGTGIEKNNIESSKAGVAVLSAGSSLIGISIPLLCFGDHIKRETNMNYELWNYMQTHQ